MGSQAGQRRRHVRLSIRQCHVTKSKYTRHKMLTTPNVLLLPSLSVDKSRHSSWASGGSSSMSMTIPLPLLSDEFGELWYESRHAVGAGIDTRPGG